MSPKAFLRVALRRIFALLTFIRQWRSRTRLRFISLILWTRPSLRPEPQIPSTSVPCDTHSARGNLVEVSCSVVPPSVAGSRTSLHVPDPAPRNLTLPSNESRHSLRASSLRSVQSFQSKYDGEELRSRARTISAEQREERIVTRPGSRLAVASSRSRSQSRTPSARQSRSNSPSPTHSVYTPSRPVTPSVSRPATPSRLHQQHGPHTSQEAGYTLGVHIPPNATTIVSADTLNIHPPTLQITTTGESPSPTSLSSSQQPGAMMDDSLLRPNAPRSPAGTSTATSPTVYNNPRDTYPQLLTPPEGRYLIEMTPDDLPRYKRRATTPKRENSLQLLPLTTVFPHGSVETSDKAKEMQPRTPANLLEAWESFTHPEGIPYFFHPGKRIWTNAYLHKQFHYDEVDQCADLLDQARQIFLDNGYSFPLHYELVIDISALEHNESELRWQYYYIDHETRSVFWLRPHILWKELETVKGVVSLDHAQHKIQEFYWHHIFQFPEGRRDLATFFGVNVWRELSSVIDFDMLDVAVSPTSNSLYSHTELALMKKLVDSAYDQSAKSALLPTHLSAVARIQMKMAEQRFTHAYGQPFARLHCNDSIHPDTDGHKPVSFLFRSVDLLLFYGPSSLLENLHNVLVDDIVLEHRWRRYFQRLLDDWDRLLIPGTVILAVNVSFLALPGVIYPGSPSQKDGEVSQSAVFTWSGLLSFSSTLLSLGSVLNGLLLARRNRSQVEHATDADEARIYLQRHISPIFELEPIAIKYSLPYALLLWGTGFFLAAILCFTLEKNDTATLIVMGIGALVVTGLLLWSTLSGKLGILRKTWVPFKETEQYEWLEETCSDIAQAASKCRRFAWAQLILIAAYPWRAATDPDGTISEQGSQIDVQRV